MFRIRRDQQRRSCELVAHALRPAGAGRIWLRRDPKLQFETGLERLSQFERDSSGWEGPLDLRSGGLVHQKSANGAAT